MSEPNLAVSDTISVSFYKLKQKYYNKDTDAIDKSSIKADIDKLTIDIESIQSNGLYTYNSKSGKYVKVFDSLKEDYLKILKVKRKALENFLDIVTFKNIVIPDSLKKHTKRSNKTEE